jgi:hypothetical protein
MPGEWRLVSMDNFLGVALKMSGSADWTAKQINIAEACLEFWKNEKVNRVLLEGVIRTPVDIARLATAFGEQLPSRAVCVIQLNRSLETHKRRRLAPGAWDPPLPAGSTREQGIGAHEGRVPPPIGGARQIGTDLLTREEVLEAAVRFLQ